MKALRWMSRVITKDGIKNEYVSIYVAIYVKHGRDEADEREQTEINWAWNKKKEIGSCKNDYEKKKHWRNKKRKIEKEVIGYNLSDKKGCAGVSEDHSLN